MRAIDANPQISIFAYTGPSRLTRQRRHSPKPAEFKRQLAALGARFAEGTMHTKVYLNGKQTTPPHHAGREIGEGLRRAILRQLDVKKESK